VPYGGGTVTFTLVVPKRKVQRKGGDFFRTYTCRPLSATVQISVPPQH
jgi:ribosomal protein S17